MKGGEAKRVGSQRRRGRPSRLGGMRGGRASWELRNPGGRPSQLGAEQSSGRPSHLGISTSRASWGEEGRESTLAHKAGSTSMGNSGRRNGNQSGIPEGKGRRPRPPYRPLYRPPYRPPIGPPLGPSALGPSDKNKRLGFNT